MTAALYAHQESGAEWLAGRARGYLGDEPGLGKTRTLLAAAKRAGRTRPLVCCPAIVQSHWRREAAEIGIDVDVRSYDAVVRGGAALREYTLAQDGTDALILDEAHYLKHTTSRRTQLLLGLDSYARRTRPVFLASGTPMPKNPDELWAVLSSCFAPELKRHGITSHAGYLKKFCAVRHRFVRGRYVEKVGAEIRNVDEFKALLADVMLVRKLDDVGLDVPALDFQLLRLDLPSGHVPSYMDQLLPADVVHDVTEALAAGTLESIANDPHVARMRRRLGELKVGPVAETLAAQLGSNEEKVCVFAHHTSVLRGLAELLKEFGVAFVDGGVSGAARDLEIDRFQTDPSVRVFVGQNLACGTGTDGLQRATHRAVLVEPDWTAANNVQLGKRVARIGSERGRCVAQMATLAGTLDEAIVGQHWREVRLAREVGL